MTDISTQPRSHRIVSDDSSELSDLDSEAETERLDEPEVENTVVLQNMPSSPVREPPSEALSEAPSEAPSEAADVTPAAAGDVANVPAADPVEVHAQMPPGESAESAAPAARPPSPRGAQQSADAEPPADGAAADTAQDADGAADGPDSTEPQASMPAETDTSRNGHVKVEPNGFLEPLDSESSDSRQQPRKRRSGRSTSSDKKLDSKRARTEERSLLSHTDKSDKSDKIMDEDDIEEEEEEESDVEGKRQREEELQKERQRAIVMLTEIEVDFANLRDMLYASKMKQFLEEIDLCSKGLHPEQIVVTKQIRQACDDKIKQAKSLRDYSIKCVEIHATCARAQLHQQFYKDKAEARAKLLHQTTKEWYKVNRERRAMDQLAPPLIYKVPTSIPAQVVSRQRLNNEISILSGLAEYVGFPAAPQMQPAAQEEIEDDINAIRRRLK